MGFNYKPQSFTKANKGSIKKYEASLKNLEQYIHNLITSHDYLQQQVEIDKNEFAQKFGLVTDFDICSGVEIDVAQHCDLFLKSYIDKVIKRAYLMGICSGDTKGTTFALREVKKQTSLKNKERRSKPNCVTEALRNDLRYLIAKDYKEHKEDVIDFQPARYIRMYKLYVEEKSAKGEKITFVGDGTLRKHISKIRMEVSKNTL